jgi:hypothetical protein
MDTITRMFNCITDIESYNTYFKCQSLELDPFIKSGAVAHVSYLDNFLNSSEIGRTHEVYSLLPLPDVEPDIANDNTMDQAPVRYTKPTIAVRQSLTERWEQGELATMPLDSEQYKAIANHWLNIRHKRILLSIIGLLANSGNDLFLTSDNLINNDAIINAAYMMGNLPEELTGMVVHSRVMATMKRLGLIETERLPNTNIYTYLHRGCPVLIDDGLTVEAIPSSSVPGVSPAHEKYSSFLFGPSAFSFGQGQPKLQMEYERHASSGSGGCIKILTSRVEWMLHPWGYTYKLSETPTPAQLQDGTNWERIEDDRKRIKLAVLITNG